MSLYPESMEKLIIELSNLPTIGRKSAKRLALKIVEMDDAQVSKLAESLMAVKEKDVKTILVAGGVSANRRLREKFLEFTNIKTDKNKQIEVHFPKMEYCTDKNIYETTYKIINEEEKLLN